MRYFSYLFLLFLYTTETPFYTPQSLHYPISFEIRRWTDFLRLNFVRCQLSPEVEDQCSPIQVHERIPGTLISILE